MMASRSLGAVAAGHPATAAAAEFALREGGNAFDAVIAAHWCACVAEPVLTSLGGGGFLLAQPAAGNARVYDFFAQTPKNQRPRSDIEFHPINADFGTTHQEFHIGYGAAATPGTVRGLFAIHRELALMPMRLLVEPAVQLAREGVEVNELQAYILDVVRPIYLATAEAAKRFASHRATSRLVQQGEVLRLPELGETLEALAEQGERLFYEGEIATAIEAGCRSNGGHLRRRDLAEYRVITRAPLVTGYRGATLLTNPPPSSGGLLIAFALKLLERQTGNRTAVDSVAGLSHLAEVMRATNEARLKAQADDLLNERLLDRALIDQYLHQVLHRTPAFRGTTHISAIDAAGNIAALTTSNGEGCGHMLDHYGFMLNNMLGEEDLCPHGFHHWQPDQRLTSMMSPSVLQTADGARVALGSGGSNRIRSAILQVLVRLVDQGLDLEHAITSPRVHFENGVLSIEGGFDESVYRQLEREFDELRRWPGCNLFFGGVHAVRSDGKTFECFGDARRGGVAYTVS